MKAIYKFHPSFANANVQVWWGDPEVHWGSATFEGGDVLIPGNGVVLVGMSERTSRQAITQVASALFAKGAADHVIIAAMPKLRAAMHLDTVFTFADRDVVCVFPNIVYQMHAISLRPGKGPFTPRTTSVKDRPRQRHADIPRGVPLRRARHKPRVGP